MSTSSTKEAVMVIRATTAHLGQLSYLELRFYADGSVELFSDLTDSDLPLALDTVGDNVQWGIDALKDSLVVPFSTVLH